jgi:hypothetical protein
MEAKRKRIEARGNDVADTAGLEDIPRRKGERGRLNPTAVAGLFNWING